MLLQKTEIPQTDSIAELARFWDAHDLTDFADQLEEVQEPIFEQELSVTIRLQPEEAEAIKKAAEAKGIPNTDLIQLWVREKLQLA
jgi:predicted DNA binding CopG/RHH family protein